MVLTRRVRCDCCCVLGCVLLHPLRAAVCAPHDLPCHTDANVSDRCAEHAAQSAAPSSFCCVHHGATTAAAVRDLVPGSFYAWRVCATNDVGSSAFTDVVVASTASGAPSAPTNVRARQVQSTSICLEWEPPLETNGAPVTGSVVFPTASRLLV